MTPDRHIVDEIHRDYPDIRVSWDQGVERWRLDRKAEDGQYEFLWHVQEPDGSFRPLDQRVVRHLHETDTWKLFGRGWGDLKACSNRMIQAFVRGKNDMIKEASRKRFMQLTDHMKDVWLTIHRSSRRIRSIDNDMREHPKAWLPNV